jgi:hypothetical protein
MERTPTYERVDRHTAAVVRQYVEDRFREAGWCDPNQPCAPTDMTVDTFPDAYHVIVRVPVSRKDIPDAILQLAIEVEEELVRHGYPTGVIVRPTVLPVAAL